MSLPNMHEQKMAQIVVCDPCIFWSTGRTFCKRPRSIIFCRPNSKACSKTGRKTKLAKCAVSWRVLHFLHTQTVNTSKRKMLLLHTLQETDVLVKLHFGQ